VERSEMWAVAEMVCRCEMPPSEVENSSASLLEATSKLISNFAWYKIVASRRFYGP
jgi:hypothetical protein